MQYDDTVIDDMRAIADYLENLDRGDVTFPAATFQTGTNTLDFAVSAWDLPDSGWSLPDDEKAEKMLEWIRSLVKQIGGSWAKNDPKDSYFDDAYYTLTSKTHVLNGHIAVRVITDRNSVCERVQVGTKTKVIPAVEAAPERTIEEPVFERDCKPLFTRAQSEDLESVIS